MRVLWASILVFMLVGNAFGDKFVVDVDQTETITVSSREESKQSKQAKGSSEESSEEVVKHHRRVKIEQHFRRDVGSEVPKVKMDQPTKEALLTEKKEHVFFEKEIEYFTKNPNSKYDRECYSKMKPGHSIDFVIDLAPSPSQDKIDKLLAEESPFSLFLQQFYRSASRAYFGSVQFFIDTVTVGLKPEWTHSIIYDNGSKYIIRGRNVEDEKLHSGREFSDDTRNLKTLWPTGTKEVNSYISSIVKNNLGRMTNLALWNRDNGLPTVLASSRRSKPIYTVVISDGSSGAKIHELSDDLSRTTVIDVGNRRFAETISTNDLKLLAGLYTLVAPQQLPWMFDTIRVIACDFIVREH